MDVKVVHMYVTSVRNADKYVCSTEKKVASDVIVTKVLDDR